MKIQKIDTDCAIIVYEQNSNILPAKLRKHLGISNPRNWGELHQNLYQHTFNELAATVRQITSPGRRGIYEPTYRVMIAIRDDVPEILSHIENNIWAKAYKIDSANMVELHSHINQKLMQRAFINKSQKKLVKYINQPAPAYPNQGPWLENLTTLNNLIKYAEERVQIANNRLFKWSNKNEIAADII